MKAIQNKNNKFLALIGWTLSLTILIPIFMVVINSFKDSKEASLMKLTLPTTFHIIENYKEMIESGGILTGFVNSIIVTIISVTLIIMFSSALAFYLQRSKSKFSKAMLTLIIMGLVFPLQIIPAFFLCDLLGLPNYFGAISILTVVNIPFCVFTYTGYLKGVSTNIDEAGIVDGASPLTLFFRIILPLLKPVTVTNIIIAFMSVWNDFGISIYFLNNSKNYTLPLTIYNFTSTHSSDWQLVFANVVVVSLPVLIVYLLLQKHIISGMTSGSVKG